MRKHRKESLLRLLGLSPRRRRRPAVSPVVAAAPAIEALEPRILLSAVSLSVVDTPMAEAAGVATVTATLDAPAVGDVVIPLNFAGSATAGSDYNASAASITILNGQTAGSITLTAVDDLEAEVDETILVSLGTLPPGTDPGATTQVSAQIIDNDEAAPVANNDNAATDEDMAVVISVLGNDTDANGDALTPSVVAGPANGTLTVNADGTITYTPNANFNGSDSFTYKVNDGTADSNTATVSITINPVNDAPVATDDAYSVNEDHALNVAAAGVLANDIDLDSAALTASVLSGPANGTLVLNADGSFQYTPNLDFTGSDSFTYTVSDGALTDTATVTITVISAEDQLENLQDAVADLKSDGLLNKGQANALTKKLGNALKKLKRGQFHVADNMLGAFVNQVESLIGEGTLPSEDGQPLIDAALAAKLSIITTDPDALPPGKAKGKGNKPATPSNNNSSNGNNGGNGSNNGNAGGVDPAEVSGGKSNNGKKKGKNK